jgi:hypothetical protein
VVKFFVMQVDISVFLFVFFVISCNFDFFYLCVYCIVFSTGYYVFLVLDSGCSPSVVLFALITV